MKETIYLQQTLWDWFFCNIDKKWYLYLSNKKDYGLISQEVSFYTKIDRSR